MNSLRSSLKNSLRSSLKNSLSSIIQELSQKHHSRTPSAASFKNSLSSIIQELSQKHHSRTLSEASFKNSLSSIIQELPQQHHSRTPSAASFKNSLSSITQELPQQHHSRTPSAASLKNSLRTTDYLQTKQVFLLVYTGVYCLGLGLRFSNTLRGGLLRAKTEWRARTCGLRGDGLGRIGGHRCAWVAGIVASGSVGHFDLSELEVSVACGDRLPPPVVWNALQRPSGSSQLSQTEETGTTESHQV